MKITHIEAIPLVRKLEHVFQGGTYQITSRNTIVTRVELESGVVGEIYGGDEDQYQLDVCHVVNDIYRPLLVGCDVRDVELNWQRMWETRIDLAHRGVHTLDLAKHCAVTMAIAAVDNASWDALGKFLGQPVYKLLGGYRDRVPVLAIGGYVAPQGATGKTAADLEAEVEYYKSRGIFGLKLKVGYLSVEEDVERTRLARRAGGPDFHLSADANQAWTVEQAMQYARGVHDLGLAWLEEPVRWYEQLEGNARVRSLGIPVTAGQGEISRHGCRELITHGAVDILNVDVTIAAGVTEWRRIAAMAQCFGVMMAHHEEPQIALHLLAAVPNGLRVEVLPVYKRDPMWFDLPERRPLIVGGDMLLTDESGFGMPLRHDTIEQWRYRGGDR